MSTAITLRPYQVEARANVAASFLDDHDYRLLGVLPTGCGKTRIFAETHHEERLDAWMQTFPESHRKILVIAHRDELITQAQEKLSEVNPQLRVEIEQADQWASPEAEIVVASIQTLGNRSGKRLMRFEPEQFRIVIIDEAHHATAASYVRVLQYFGILPPDNFMLDERPKNKETAGVLAWQRERLTEWDARVTGQPPTLLFGLTATPKRGDSIGLEAVFSKIAFHRDIREMISEGWLCRLRGRRVKSTVSLDQVHTLAGDFIQNELAAAVNKPTRNQLAVKAYVDHAPDRSAVVFCVDVAHATTMAEAFNVEGISAAVIHGELPKPDRKLLLQQFHLGELRVLTNCQVLTEGWDEPMVGCIIHAAPTKSSLLYAQRTGRGTRLWNPDVKGFFGVAKTDCLVIDLVDLTKKHSLASVADLFGLPQDFDIQGADLVDLANTVDQLRVEHAHADLEDCTSLEDIETTVEDVDLFSPNTPSVILNNAKVAWLQVNAEHYHLRYTAPTFPETIDIQRTEAGRWDILLSTGSRSCQNIAVTQQDLPSAFHAAEKWMASKRPAAFAMTSQAARWRKEPPSDTQVAELRRLNIVCNWRSLTKGQVSDLLTYHKLQLSSRHRVA